MQLTLNKPQHKLQQLKLANNCVHLNFKTNWCFVACLSLVRCVWEWSSTTGLLKWRTAVRIRTFGWCRPDLDSFSNVYSLPKSFYPNILRFWPCY